MASFFNILRCLVHGSPVHSARKSGSSELVKKKWAKNREKLQNYYEHKWKKMEAKVEATLQHVEIAEAERANAEKARVVAENERVIAEHNRVNAGEKKKEEDEKRQKLHGGV